MSYRAVLKTIVKTFFLIIVYPIFITYKLLGLLNRSDNGFAAFSQFFSLIPGKPGIYSRAAFFRLCCTNTSDHISVGFLTLLSHANTTIHEGVYIGPQCNIGMCSILKDTLIGSGVHILSGNKQHYFDNSNLPIQSQGGQFIKISIGDDCWIGNGSIIMADVGRKCIVAAGSVVTKALPDSCIAAGNPARIIKYRAN
ncbi:acyltransferase [Marinobacter bryozoorum]|uniref:acyltransferase n=1 Tax=Marinobacter bryozoorum TaxID=256324 RepID=UPI0020052363|nr:acyltransferase [Marinobacter bryozoorum]MCK7544040.1 acyltransferase [Marinobacter bryozoorum]